MVIITHLSFGGSRKWHSLARVCVRSNWLVATTANLVDAKDIQIGQGVRIHHKGKPQWVQVIGISKVADNDRRAF